MNTKYFFKKGASMDIKICDAIMGAGKTPAAINGKPRIRYDEVVRQSGVRYGSGGCNWRRGLVRREGCCCRTWVQQARKCGCRTH